MADPTPQQWAATVLQRLGIHQTPGAVQALTGWAKAEGGHWNNQALYNPLNTTQPMPGAGNTGSQGNIKVYRNWDQGIQATVKTLQNGRYGGILSALRSGSPQAVADAIGKTPWGTSGSLVQQTIMGTPKVAGVQAFGTSGSPSSPSSGGAPALRTKQVGGVDNSASRGAMIASFVLGGDPRYTQGTKAQGMNSSDPLQFALGMSKLKDVAPRTVTYRPSGSTGASSSSSPASVPATGGGYKVATFEGTPVASWMVPALQYARSQGWTGKVTSGVRTSAEQAQLYAAYKAGRGNIAAKPGQSNHEIQNGGAFDASQPQQLHQILQGYKGQRPVWAPSVGLNDAVHFSLTGH